MGAHKRGLEPQIFRENRAKILPRKPGVFRPDWSLFRAYWGLFRADEDQFLRTSHPRGGSRNFPLKGPFLVRLAPFGSGPYGLIPTSTYPRYDRSSSLEEDW